MEKQDLNPGNFLQHAYFSNMHFKPPSHLSLANFLVSSLNKKKLHRVKFDQDYNKIIYSEEIHTGDRIKNLLYNLHD